MGLPGYTYIFLTNIYIIMAIFSSTLMTRAKGSVGNITIVTSKGRMIAKQKISIMSNPKTERQQSQRKGLALAVALWKYIGSTIKSGITIYPQFGSQYNGFVRANIEFLKSSTVTPDAIRNQDLRGLQATSGNLGNFTFTVDEILPTGTTFSFPAGALRQVAKVGDVVKFVVGSGLQSEMGYFEHSIVPQDLDPATTSFTISGAMSKHTDNSVYAVWLESSDTTKSTSSKFLEY